MGQQYATSFLVTQLQLAQHGQFWGPRDELSKAICDPLEHFNLQILKNHSVDR